MINNKKIKQNEQGLASFLVTLIMMIVISLVVLGFAQLARREQRESLDNQLSAAAYYAAESGVNDAIQAINSGYTGSKTTCPPLPPGNQFLDNGNVGNGSSITCLLINNVPSQLTFQDVATNESTMTPLATTANGSLTINWKNVTGPTNKYTGCPAVGKFPPSWQPGKVCGAGILRIDLIPQNALAQSNDLQDFTYTGFLVPHNGGGGSINLPGNLVPPPVLPLPPPSPTVPIPPNQNGVITAGSCGASGCSVNITNIDTFSTTWYLRMISIYNDSSVSISSSAPGGFLKAQIDIDSTGKANDVLKRILVAVPYNGSVNDTPFALQTTDSICKHYDIINATDTPSDPGGVPFSPDTSSCYGHP